MTKHTDTLHEAAEAATPRGGLRPPCATCDFWAEQAPPYGECRRDTPVLPPEHLSLRGEVPNLGWWPATHRDDGCGHHQDFYSPAMAEGKRNETTA